MPASPNLTLQPECAAAVVPSARRVTREHYQRQQDDYAAQYGYAVRAIKRWLQIGREKDPASPDLPPLDSPVDMPAWWTRNMKQRVPARLLNAAKAAAAPSSTPPPPDAPEAATAPPLATPPMQASDDAALHGSGFAAMIARAEHTERAAWKAWQEALAAKPFSAAEEELRRRVYDRASEQARKIYKDRETGLAGDEEWGRWSEIEEIVNEHIAVLQQSLRGSPVRVATKLSLPHEVFRRMDDSWNAELDRIFDALNKVDWRKSVNAEELSEGEPFELKAAA